MIEQYIQKELKKQLNLPVVLEHKDNEPKKFVLFEKTGGGRKNQINTATFAFQSYAPSLYEAAELNDKVKLAVFNLVNVSDIGGVRLNSDYNFTDITEKRYRYQAVFDITY